MSPSPACAYCDAADNLTRGHIVEADIFVSSDDQVIALDGLIVNRVGKSIRVCDTDLALTLL